MPLDTSQGRINNSVTVPIRSEAIKAHTSDDEVVKSCGPGIPAELAACLYQPFPHVMCRVAHDLVTGLDAFARLPLVQNKG